VIPEGFESPSGRAQVRTGLRRVAENVSWLVGERSLLLILNFAVSVWFINYLGPNGYGLYAYAVSFATLFASLATLGTDQIVIRELSRTQADRGEILGTAFAMRIMSSVGTFGLIAISIFVASDDSTTRLLVMVVAISVLANPAQVVDLWFQSRIESKFVVWVRTGVSLVAIGTKAALILLEMPLIAFGWLYASQAILMGIGFLGTFAVRRPSGLRLRRTVSRGLALLRDAWPLIISGLSVTIYMRIDSVMLGQLLGNRDVGTYSTAATLSELWNFIPVVVTASLFPIVVRSRESGDQRLFDQRMQALFDVMAIGAYTVALPVTLLAPWLVDVLFSAEFAESGRILRIHIWSLVFVALGVSRSRYIVAENLIRFSMWATLAGGLANVGLNFLLIPRYGGIGAAWATLISYVLAAYVSGLFLATMRPTTLRMTKALLAPLRPRAAWSEIRAILR
jgi:O-antigen/teichoic acid export membrane protein